MPMTPIPLGPWPLGQDNVADPAGSVYQVPAQGQPPARLVRAENVDLDDDGWPSRRPGMTLAAAATDARAAVSVGGLLLLQDGGRIERILPAPRAALVAGLSGAPVHFCAFQGQVFWTDGLACGAIDRDGAATNWGLPVPRALLSAAPGPLPAGTYRVALTFVDAAGREGGARQASEITLSAPGGIRVGASAIAPAVRWVDVYASPGPDQPELNWCQRVAVEHLPALITSTRVSTRPLRTQHHRGPIPGAGVFAWRGFLFTFRARTLYHARPKAAHLFYPGEQRHTFPHTIRAGVGLADGFYVATAGGLFWVAGDEPTNWRLTRVDSRVYKAGSATLSGRKLPALQVAGEVALLASEDGLIVGLPGGQALAPTDARLRLDGTSAAASIVYREQTKTIDGADVQFRQLLMALR